MRLTILKHELLRNRLSIIVWSAVMAFVLGICIIIYPEMQTQMADIGDMFADMGAFSEAFGMDKINFGEFMGYFGVECGNTLGIGGALLASIVGVGLLSGEERDGTAELLLTLPVTRTRVVSEKLLYGLSNLAIVNLAVYGVCIIGTLAIGAEADYGIMSLILLSYFLMQIEILTISLAVSTFTKGAGIGIAVGIGFGFYFMGILANLTDALEFIKYLTPFGFAESGYIISEGALEPISLAVGALLSAGSVALTYYRYNKKDIS